MDVPKRTKRRRAILAAAVAGIVAAGLGVPFFVDATSTDISLHSAAVIAATRDSYTVTTPVAMSFMPNVIIEAGTISLFHSGRGEPINGAAALALLAGGKAKLVLDDAMLALGQARSTTAQNSDGGQALAPLLSALLQLSFSQLDLRNSSLRLERSDGSNEVISGVTLSIKKASGGLANATGSFIFRNRPVKFDLSLGTMPELKNSGISNGASIGRKLNIKLSADLFELDAKGTLSAGEKPQPQFNANTSEVKVKDVRGLVNWLGVNWPDGKGLGQFTAAGPLDVTPSSIAFSDATFDLDGNAATGAFAVKWSGKRPALDGTLAFTTFDVTPYVLRSDASENPKPFLFSDYLIQSNGDTRLAPWLGEMDADLRVSAGNVAVGSIKLGRAAASLSLRDGMLLADLAELELDKGGRCSGQLGVSLKNGIPNYTLIAKVEAIDTAILTNAFWSYSVLSGKGDVTVDLNGSGITAETLLASIAGRASIVQQGSGQIGLDLRTLAATARAEMQKGWGGATRGQTAIEGLTAQFSLSDGELITEKVGARAGDAMLSAVGKLSLPDKVGDVKVWITHPAAVTVKPSTAPEGATEAATAPAVAAGAVPVTPGGVPSNDTAAKTPQPHAPGGGLHVLGPLSAPEIRFIPLTEAKPGEPALGSEIRAKPPSGDRG